MIISFTRHIVKLFCILLSYEGIHTAKQRERERYRKKRLFVSKVWYKLASRLNLFAKRGLFAKIAGIKERTRISYYLKAQLELLLSLYETCVSLQFLIKLQISTSIFRSVYEDYFH